MPTNISTSIHEALEFLRQGKLVAIPTETVYGLAADAKNISAIEKIFAVKRRPKTNPLIIHLSDPAAITEWAIHIPKIAYQLIEHFWPGPLTLILARHPDVPKIVTGNQETVGLRVPNHPVTLELLHAFGGGLAAPSANRFGAISPTTAQHVSSGLGEEVDYILDGGPCKIGIESTIVSLVNEEPIILRQGMISQALINETLGYNIRIRSVTTDDASPKIIVPGSDLHHYAPQTPLYLLEKEYLSKYVEEFSKTGAIEFLNSGNSTNSTNKKNNRFLNNVKRIGVLSFMHQPEFFNQTQGVWIKASEDPKIYAKNLYAILHELDNSECNVLLVEMPINKEDWLAVRDRLSRASRNVLKSE